MSASSLQLAFANLTTIENLSKRTSIWYLAVYIPRPDLLPQHSNPNSPPLFRTVTFPQPTLHTESRSSAKSQSPTPTPAPSPPARMFAILESRRGDNPFDLGSPLLNLQEVMGYTLLDWLLPLKPSPCADHSNGESAFKLGPAVLRMKEEAGLVPYTRVDSEASSRKRLHRRKRRNHYHMKDLGDQKDSSRRRRKHRRKHGARDKDGGSPTPPQDGLNTGVLG
jgi:palmitoyltransferase